jgi:PAS domain S-box-containing protein
MKTVFIGGGQACREVLELVQQGRLDFFGVEVLAVVDRDSQAPGLAFAQAQGWTTLKHLKEGLALPGLELVIELTGEDRVLDRVHRHVPEGVRVIDHVMARVFWDLEKVARDLRQELRIRTELQAKVASDRAQLQDILDAIPDLVLVLDLDARSVRVNQRFERVTGKLRDKVLGKPVREVFQTPGEEDWSQELAGLFEEVVSSGRPVTVTRKKKTRSGRSGHFQIAANPIFDENLEIARVVETAREITELVMLKRETEESAQRFQQIVNAVHGLITIKDLDGRYLVVNPWTSEVIGIPRDEMVGKTAAELFPRESADLIHKLDRATLTKGERHVSEEILNVGGKERIFVSERVPLTDYKGEVIGICCVSQDQTRQRQLQRDLVRSERLAAVGKLSAGVAHELNNPLSGILTIGEDLLLEADADDERRHDYEVIVNETMRCRHIVRNLLEYSRQRKPRRQRMELGSLILRVLPIVERQASFQNVEIKVSLSEKLPEVSVDPHQMQQVLLNLIINARDAMKARGTISISGEPANRGRAAALAVADSGCGISEPELEHIFEPFHSSKGEQGHGLGLTTVRSVVERHGGRVEVESEVDVGTTFRVVLPAATD